jgi:hypothetical protein
LHQSNAFAGEANVEAVEKGHKLFVEDPVWHLEPGFQSEIGPSRERQMGFSTVSFGVRGAKMTWPKTYTAEAAPRTVLALAEQLVPQLLAGDHPVIEALRVQYERGRVETVELTGAGFYVNYRVPDDAPHARPPDFQGGNARIEAIGVSHGAGCVLFVRGGQLAFLEGYTYGEVWPEHAELLAVEDVRPLEPPQEATT